MQHTRQDLTYVLFQYMAQRQVTIDLRWLTMIKNFTQMRSPAPNVELDQQACQWMETLPVAKRPVRLAQLYPRILNRIASCWKRRDQCHDYFSQLLFDTNRFDRKGFPLDVAQEISTLDTMRTRASLDPTMHQDGAFKF